jgi:hypothetical protein
MPSLRLSRRLLALVSFCLSNLPSGLGQEPFQVKFRVVKDMIVVPVTINGAGPFESHNRCGSDSAHQSSTENSLNNCIFLLRER